jgi:hypothetical protein
MSLASCYCSTRQLESLGRVRLHQVLNPSRRHTIHLRAPRGNLPGPFDFLGEKDFVFHAGKSKSTPRPMYNGQDVRNRFLSFAKDANHVFYSAFNRLDARRRRPGQLQRRRLRS